MTCVRLVCPGAGCEREHESAPAWQSWFNGLDKDKDGSLSLQEKLAGATGAPSPATPTPECPEGLASSVC